MHKFRGRIIKNQKFKNMLFFIKIQKFKNMSLRKSKIPKISENEKSKNKFFILYIRKSKKSCLSMCAGFHAL